MATRIAVDAMGGDDAPEVVVQGAAQAARNSDDSLELVLFGPEDRVRPALASVPDHGDLPIRIEHAPDVIEMSDAPAAAVKQKRRSSIHLGLGAHKKGAVDAFVSAGNTGAVMAASIFILGRIPGIERPSIAGFFPTLRGSSVVIDIGTNVDCKPEHLVQFAQMGTVFSQHILKRDTPSVGLLNIGEEPGKGNEQVKRTYKLLGDTPDVHFKGNIEGGDLLFYASDIILCDGFVGNILLKFGETMTTVLTEMTRQEMDHQGLSADEQHLVAGVLNEVKKGFDVEDRGGAPLLGVSGNVFIGHGSSSADAVEQMVYSVRELVDEDIVGALQHTFAVDA